MVDKEKYVPTKEDKDFIKMLAQRKYDKDTAVVVTILTCRNKKCKEVSDWLVEHEDAQAEDVLEFIQTLDLSFYP